MVNSALDVWTQMNYMPPRGQCHYKESILSARCPCLRFMLHPLKSSSSFECDGCSHHASFHGMENKMEDEIRRRWEQEAKEKTRQENETQQRPKKRVRAIEYNNDSCTVAEADNEFGMASLGVGGNTRGRGSQTKRRPRTANSSARGQMREPVDEDDAVIELN